MDNRRVKRLFSVFLLYELLICPSNSSFELTPVNVGAILTWKIYPSSPTDINLEGNGIQEIETTAFSAYSSVTFLSIAQNQVNTIADAAFKGLNLLEVLDLSFNEISTFPDLADVKDTLTALYLSHNSIDYIGSELTQYPALLILDLGYNLLSEFTIADSVPSIKRLFLAGNKLSNMPELSTSQEYLKELNVAENFITDIVSEYFEKTPNLRKLFLQANSLTELTPNMPEYLIELNIANNQFEGTTLKSFVDANTGFKYLESLDLSGVAKFTENAKLYSRMIRSCEALIRLGLNNLNLPSIETIQKIAAPTLTHLHVNDNHIEELAPEDVELFENLEFIDARNNRIGQIPNMKQLAADRTNDVMINLKGNDLLCDYSLCFIEGQGGMVENGVQSVFVENKHGSMVNATVQYDVPACFHGDPSILGCSVLVVKNSYSEEKEEGQDRILHQATDSQLTTCDTLTSDKMMVLEYRYAFDSLPMATVNVTGNGLACEDRKLLNVYNEAEPIGGTPVIYACAFTGSDMIGGKERCAFECKCHGHTQCKLYIRLGAPNNVKICDVSLKG